MNNPSDGEYDKQIIEPTMMCEACARIPASGTEWHSLREEPVDRQRCTQRVEGPGYWVCGDCHQIVHDWMDRNPDAQHPAKEGLQRIFRQLAEIVEQPARKYKRSQPPTGGDDDTA